MALCEEDLWQRWVENYVSCFHPIQLAEALFNDSLIDSEAYHKIVEQYTNGQKMEPFKSHIVKILKQFIALKSLLSVFKFKGYENPHMIRRTWIKPNRLVYVHFRAVKRDVHNGRYANTFNPLRLMAGTLKQMLQSETNLLKKQFIADKYIAHLGAEIDAIALKFDTQFVNDPIFDELYNVIKYSTNTLIPQTIFLSRKANAFVINGNFDEAEKLFNDALQCATDLMPCLELVYVYYLDVVFKLWKLESNSTKDAKLALQNMARTGLDLLQYEDDEIRTYLTRQFFIRIVSGLLGIGNNGNIYKNFQVDPEEILEAKRLLKKIRHLWDGIELRQIMFYSVAKAKIFHLEKDISSAYEYSAKAVQIAKCAGFSEVEPLEQYLVHLELKLNNLPLPQHIFDNSPTRALQATSMDSKLTLLSLFHGVSSTDQETESFNKTQSCLSESVLKSLECNLTGYMYVSKVPFVGENENVARARRDRGILETCQSNLRKVYIDDPPNSMTKQEDCVNDDNWRDTDNQVGKRASFVVNRGPKTRKLIFSVESRRDEIQSTLNSNQCYSAKKPQFCGTQNLYDQYRNENSRIAMTEFDFNQIRTSLESTKFSSELDVWELLSDTSNTRERSDTQATFLSTNCDGLLVVHDPRCESRSDVLENEWFSAPCSFLKMHRECKCSSDHCQKTSLEGTDLYSELNILDLLNESLTSRTEEKSENQVTFLSTNCVHDARCENRRDLLHCEVLENKNLSAPCSFVGKQLEYKCSPDHFQKTSLVGTDLYSELNIWDLLNDASRTQEKSENQASSLSTNCFEVTHGARWGRNPLCWEVLRNESHSASRTYVKTQCKYKPLSDQLPPADIHFTDEVRCEDPVKELGDEFSKTERVYQISSCQHDVGTKMTCSPLEFKLSNSQHPGQSDNLIPLFFKRSRTGAFSTSDMALNVCDVNSLELFGNRFNQSFPNESYLDDLSSINVFEEVNHLSLESFLQTQNNYFDTSLDVALTMSQSIDSFDSEILFGDGK